MLAGIMKSSSFACKSHIKHYLLSEREIEALVARIEHELLLSDFVIVKISKRGDLHRS
jgi:hypothetical protein